MPRSRRHFRHRRTAAALRVSCAVVTLGALAAGCSSSAHSKSAGSSASGTTASAATTGAFPSQSIIDAANSEGKVLVDTSTAPADNSLVVAAFNKVYPKIKVEVTRATPTTLEPQIEAAIRTKTDIPDVYLTTDRPWQVTNENLLAPLQTPLASTSGSYGPWVSEGGKVVGFSFYPGGVEWNTKEIPGGIASFQAVASLPSSTTIGVLDPKLSTGALAWEYNAAKTFGAPWLKQVLSHKLRYYPESTSLVAAVTSGEVAVGIPGFIGFPIAAKKAGAPVDSIVGSPSFVTLFTASVLSAGKDQSAAQLFIDFLLTPAGQAAINQEKLSPLSGIPGTLGVAKEGQTNVADIGAISAADQAAFLKEFDSDAGRG